MYISKHVKGRRIDEHRLVMEAHIGRRLGRYELVHHINGIKSNNNIKGDRQLNPISFYKYESYNST